jgi:indole-3-glycerol phosphate synthase
VNSIRPPDVLSRICAETRIEVTRRRATITMGQLRDKIAAVGPTRGFGQRLKQRCASQGLGLIAEIKKASPSGGLIRADFDPAELAQAYAEGGASCLSVLTEWSNFQGTPADLKLARKAVSLPVLRKDFIIDPWQIIESRAIGADCILLIMAVLSDDTAREFEDQARGLDMDVLVEVHDEAELERALGLRSGMIGINNRNLKTMRTDLVVTEQLAPLVPPGVFLIAESGIASRADAERIARAGVHGMLVGESLMRQADVTLATRRLLGRLPSPAL